MEVTFFQHSKGTVLSSGFPFSTMKSTIRLSFFSHFFSLSSIFCSSHCDVSTCGFLSFILFGIHRLFKSRDDYCLSVPANINWSLQTALLPLSFSTYLLRFYLNMLLAFQLNLTPLTLFHMYFYKFLNFLYYTVGKSWPNIQFSLRAALHLLLNSFIKFLLSFVYSSSISSSMYFFKKKKFIYLAAPGLSCSASNL